METYRNRLGPRRLAYAARSYGRFWVTTDQAAALWLISIISMPSRNLTPLDELGQRIFTLQHPPASGRGGYQHKDHSHGGGMREAPLGPDRAVSDRSEDAFDRVGRAQMHPVLGGEVVEGQQVVLILGQAGDRRRVFLLVFGGKPLQRRRSVDPALGHPDVVDVGLGGLPE